MTVPSIKRQKIYILSSFCNMKELNFVEKGPFVETWIISATKCKTAWLSESNVGYIFDKGLTRGWVSWDIGNILTLISRH